MILTLTTFLPLAGAMLIMGLRVVGGADMASGASKGISIFASLVTLAASLVALSQFNPNVVGYQLVDSAPWFGGSSYKLGVDGLAISLVAFRQTDIKKLVAYSSVAHMGFVTLGIFSFNEAGIQGAIFQMISHGVISGALFFCVGVIYDRMHTREISFYGGLVHRMPVYAALFMLFSMANVGLPGTSGFVGEILTMVGAFQASTWAAAGAALGVILSAVYMLTLYRRTVFGEMTNEKLFDIKDVTGLEFFILGLLAISALGLGVFPGIVFDLTEGSTMEVLRMIGR